jgi:hypothetical protein
MKNLRKLFHLSLLAFVLICVAGIQLNYVSSIDNSDNSVNITTNDHRPEGDVEGVWVPSGRLANAHHRPEGDVEGVWVPSGRLANAHHRPEGDVEGVWVPSGRQA